jgi:1,4-dihydroxy-2-naphthoyl-CoA hydrolase
VRLGCAVHVGYVVEAMEPAPLTAIPEGFSPPIPLDRCFDAVYGLEVLDEGGNDGVLRGRVAIRDELRQQFGLVHGGVIAALAEALASRGTWLACYPRGKVVMGMSNETNFMRPFLEGHINAAAMPRHKGHTRWVWEVQARDDQHRLCALTTVNIAVRDARPR